MKKYFFPKSRNYAYTFHRFPLSKNVALSFLWAISINCISGIFIDNTGKEICNNPIVAAWAGILGGITFWGITITFPSKPKDGGFYFDE